MLEIASSQCAILSAILLFEDSDEHGSRARRAIHRGSPYAIRRQASCSPGCPRLGRVQHWEGSGSRAVEKSRSPDASVAKDTKPPDPIAIAPLAGHNRAREEESKNPLKLSEKLSQAAAVHAKDMAEHQTLDHKGSDKSPSPTASNGWDILTSWWARISLKGKRPSRK